MDNSEMERQRQHTREQMLAQQIAQHVNSGWRVESQTQTMATVVKGKRPNHVLHLILSLVTLGIWLPVWIVLAVVMGEKRKALTV